MKHSRATTRAMAMGFLALVTAAGGCARDAGPPTSGGSDASTAINAASARILELRQRFQFPPRRRTPIESPSNASPSARSAIPVGIGTRFVVLGDGRLQAATPAALRRTAVRTANVVLPPTANAPVRLTDETSQVSIGWTMAGTQPVPVATTEEGLALYASALAGGADVVHRVDALGTEDFAVFESKPDAEEIDYDVDVSQVAGLRLVANTIEFLEATGNPALRIHPPYVIDEHGISSAATLAVQGCAYDIDPRAPWGRPTIAPGSASCRITLRWHSDAYPLLVDPSWTSAGTLVSQRNQHTASTLSSGLILLAGGQANSTYLSSAELYNPSAGTSSATGSLGTARYSHTATVMTDGQVLIVGGITSSTQGVQSCELYDPTSGTFASTGSLHTGRSFHTATFLGMYGNNQTLVAGGTEFSGGGSTAELYNPSNGTFAFTTGSMTALRQGHTASLLGTGKVLIAGGQTANSFWQSAELYDPSSQTFAATGSMTVAREAFGAAVLSSGQVLLVGGATTGRTIIASAELYDPTQGTFAATGSMAQERDQFTVTNLLEDSVLVAGGSSLSAFLSSAEIYDPKAGAFVSAGTMTTTRENAAAVLLSNTGQVLMTGGAASGTGTAELFSLDAAGSTCTTAVTCASGVCANGICCSVTCSGTCMGCPSGSACVAIKNAEDRDNCSGTMICSATGTCGLKNGQPSTSAGACASGFVSGGYCCNAACNDGCDVCTASAGATANGTCGAAAAGSAGSPACANSFVCDGTNVSCPTSCASDANCALGSYCSANGSCLPQKGQGTACNPAAGADCKAANCRACASGACTDGVCCGSSNCSTCMACNVAGKAGTCTAVPTGTDPLGQCASGSTCNGSGACGLKTGQASTNATACATGFAWDGYCCDSGCSNACDVCAASLGASADGTCTTAPRGYVGNPTCGGGVLCDGTSALCPGPTCASDMDCAASDYCSSSGTCQPQKAQGSGCNVGPGGECKTANCRECASGSCADGVCCGSGSCGVCQACAASLQASGGTNGSCSPSVAGSDPHGDCSSPSACNGAGACAPKSSATDGGGSEAAAGVTEGGAAADGSLGSEGQDGGGAQESGAPESGGSSGKAQGGAQGDQAPEGGSACRGSGSCAPYVCDTASGTCRTACTSVSDCAAPAVCDPSGHCVAPPGAQGSGGCSIWGGSERSAPSWACAAALLVVLQGARRRRRGHN